MELTENENTLRKTLMQQKGKEIRMKQLNPDKECKLNAVSVLMLRHIIIGVHPHFSVINFWQILGPRSSWFYYVISEVIAPHSIWHWRWYQKQQDIFR